MASSRGAEVVGLWPQAAVVARAAKIRKRFIKLSINIVRAPARQKRRVAAGVPLTLPSERLPLRRKPIYSIAI
jgi:hypothetical protein